MKTALYPQPSCTEPLQCSVGQTSYRLFQVEQKYDLSHAHLICFMCDCNASHTFCAQFIFLFDLITSKNLQGVPEIKYPPKIKMSRRGPFPKISNRRECFHAEPGQVGSCWSAGLKFLERGTCCSFWFRRGTFFLGQVFFVCLVWMSELWPPSSCSPSWSIKRARFCKTKAEDQRTFFFCLSGLTRVT